MRRPIVLVACAALAAVAVTCATGDAPEPAPPIETALPLPSSVVRDATHRSLGDPDDPDIARFHFIDIGQGDATLIEFPCGAVLIDTGGEQNEEFDAVTALTSYLDTFFARRTDLNRTLDLLVLTHPHLDHVRGAMAVLQQFRVRNLIDNGTENAGEIGGDDQIELHRWLEQREARGDEPIAYLHARAKDIDKTAGDVSPLIDPVGACAASKIDPKLTLLWGEVTEELETYGHDPNNHSVVMRIEFGETSALFTGDLEWIGLSRLFDAYRGHEALFDVDIYQVGHHGSRNATTRYLMEAMTPEVAVISAGPYARNLDWTARRFGHPNIAALRELVHADYGVSAFREDPAVVWIGIKGAWKDRQKEVFEQRTITRAVYATGWDGTVVIAGHADGTMAVTTEHPPPTADTALAAR